MPSPTDEDASYLLALMAESSGEAFDDVWLQARSGLDPLAVDRAVAYLDDLGAVTATRRPDAPGSLDVRLQSRGRFLFEAIRALQQAEAVEGEGGRLLPEPPLNPVASPHGLTAEDWAAVASRKGDSQTLHVVLALQFVSPHYDMKALIRNVEDRFRRAVQEYNARHAEAMITVRFEHLLAGLKPHPFNRVARDIIGADLAVFETSDWNPNVMLEMGVALTWGVPVVPLRRTVARPIVLDVSGQGFVLHENSAARILSEAFDEELVGAIERAIRSKAGPGRAAAPWRG